MLSFVRRFSRQFAFLPYVIAAGSTFYALRMRQKLNGSIQQYAQTVAALNTKDAELSDFIENAVTPLHWVSQDGRILWANQAELDLLGYTKEEYIGHPIAEFHADSEIISDILGRLSRNEILQSYEARLRSRDGGIKYVLINSSVYTQDGKFVHTRCFTHDITERKIVEEIQSRLSAIVEYSDDAIVSKTLEGIILSWNKGAQRIFGYSKEEVVGKSIRILFPPERLHEEDEFLEKLRRGEHIDHYETVRLRKDGQPIDISVTLSPIQNADGKIVRVSKIARDITEHKLIEEMQVRLSAIVEYSDDAIVSKTLKGIILSWNKGAQRIFGYSKEEVVGKSIRILFPPERLHEEDEFLEKLGRGEHIDHFETVRLHKDGHPINISVTLSPIQNAAGKIVGISKVAQDITERKQNERRINLLLKLSTAFSQALTPQQIAQVIVEQGFKSLGAMAGTVCLLVEQGTMLEMLNPLDAPETGLESRSRMPLDFSGPLNDAVRTGSIVWIESTQHYRTRYPYFTEVIQGSRDRSIICMPLKVDEKIIGGFSLAFPVEKPYDAEEEVFFMAMAHLCAQSLERTRLFEAERRERSLAEALRDTVLALNSSWELSEVFDQILNNIDRVVQHDMADIMLVDDGVAEIVRSHRYAEHGLVETEEEMENFSLRIAETHHMKWVVEHKSPSIISDTQTDKTWIKTHEPDLIRSTLMVPIVIDDNVVGFLNVNSLTPNFYTSKDGHHLQTFADQAAVAIRNAQLYQRALATAALEERQRIARDLHDSVSQTLFSANIIAEMLPRLWQTQPAKALSQAQLLHQLTRGAAAEMRVLLIELRPDSLINTHLKDILTQLGYALLGRLDIKLDMDIRDTTNRLLPPEVQIAFYRIAQESLNNIVKYAQASQVKIRLLRTENQITLTILDNGQGFDVKQISGGLGLKSMRERATNINASYSLKSTIGRGTRVKLSWGTPPIDKPALTSPAEKPVRDIA